MSYLFSSESVSEGHPDKVADQISDAIVDEYLRQDPKSRVACEVLVTTGLVVISGEVTSSAQISKEDIEDIVRRTIRQIGYTKPEYKFDGDSCRIQNVLDAQSPDIAQGVDRDGAGDQGMVFGFASHETASYMPLGIHLAHAILQELSALRRSGAEIPYLRPDAKTQVTIEYEEDHTPLRITNIVLSTQHDPFDPDDRKMLAKIDSDIKKILIPRVIEKSPENIRKLFNDEIRYNINPTGKFVIGGPHGDTGLTGRKIIVDTYGGKGAHGGGAFSGKDPTKVDRSAAYASRHIARNLVAAGVADQALVQVAYAIGVADPVSVYVDTCGTNRVGKKDGEIAKIVQNLFDLRPAAIIEQYQLRQPIYFETAAYGHMGRSPGKKIVDFGTNGTVEEREIETFTWEKEDRVEDIKTAFDI